MRVDECWTIYVTKEIGIHTSSSLLVVCSNYNVLSLIHNLVPRILLSTFLHYMQGFMAKDIKVDYF